MEQEFQPRNRAERRAAEKRVRSKKKKFNAVQANLKRLAYIQMIEKLRKIKENTNNDSNGEN